MIKKTKLTISGNAKKSIENIELAKAKSKNSVIIEKKTDKSFNKFRDKSFVQRKDERGKSFNTESNNPNSSLEFSILFISFSANKKRSLL